METFNLEMVEQSFRSYKAGSIINATVVAKTDRGLIVNIGGKSDGIIEEPEFFNLAKGTKLDVQIVNSRAEDGLVKVSAKRAVDVVEKNVQIPDIKKGAKFDAIIDGANKSGLTAFFGAYKVFVPAGEIEEFYVRDLDRYKGKTLTLVATDFDEEKRQIVASKKAHEIKDKTASRELFWNAIFINKLVTGKVVRLTQFGAFVQVDGVDCLVHNSEATYDRTKGARDVFELEKEYQFRVISIDREAGKVQLSHKSIQQHPFDQGAENIEEGQIHDAVITKILPYGAIARLENGLEGMIHISEMADGYVQSVAQVCEVGQTKTIMIKNVDREGRKLSLSIKMVEQQL